MSSERLAVYPGTFDPITNGHTDLVARAARGGTAVCGRRTFGCWGGGVGLGFGDAYKQFPGGEDCFCHFLSIGNDQWETGRQAAEKVKPYMTGDSFDHFMHGERYMQSP